MPGVTVLIPARLSSRRLAGKVLADIAGLPMVVHVMRRAALAERVERVMVATGDDEVARVVSEAGGQVVRTVETHASGTDRIAEASRRIGIGPDGLLINVQGDEPLVDPRVIDLLAESLISGSSVVTAITPLKGAPDDPSVVKTVLDNKGRAIYFSRLPIPSGGPWFRHLGIYGYRMTALQSFSRMAPGKLEHSERLEQLRLLEAGVPIDVVRVAEAGISVDTPRDLAEVRRLLEGLSPTEGIQ